MTTPSPEQQPGAGGPQAITHQERIALLVFFVVALVYAGWQIYNRHQSGVELGEDISPPTAGIVVQVEGAVVSPGLVSVPEGARVSDAIEAAGGFLPSADRGAVNLAERLEDGQRVDVPFLEEIGSAPHNDDGGGAVIRLAPPPVRRGKAEGEPEDGLVNINTATDLELQTLPGIGEELASRIVEYRSVHGPFLTIEDLMLVEGIGEARFEAVRHLITVGK
jgi:competence protein ComEA